MAHIQVEQAVGVIIEKRRAGSPAIVVDSG